MYKNRHLTEDELLTIDFNEFDEVIATQVKGVRNGTNKDTAYNTSFDPDADSGVVVSDDDIEFDGEFEVNLDDEPQAEDSGDVEVDAELEEMMGGEEITEMMGGEELSTSKKDIKEHRQVVNKSMMDFYESRRRKSTNKLVESLLVDSTVDSIVKVLTQTLSSFGIAKAQSISVIGLILDRMLKADSDEVSAPEFLQDVVGDVVNNKDIEKLVKKAIEDALEGDNHPKSPTQVDTQVNTIINNEVDETVKADS